jgi:hypothetical protein
MVSITVVFVQYESPSIFLSWEILKELTTEPILDDISKYKTSHIQHVDRMQRNRLLALF